MAVGKAGLLSRLHFLISSSIVRPDIICEGDKNYHTAAQPWDIIYTTTPSCATLLVPKNNIVKETPPANSMLPKH